MRLKFSHRCFCFCVLAVGFWGPGGCEVVLCQLALILLQVDRPQPVPANVQGSGLLFIFLERCFFVFLDVFFLVFGGFI